MATRTYTLIRDHEFHIDETDETYWVGPGGIHICADTLDDWVEIPERAEKLYLYVSDTPVRGAYRVKRKKPFVPWVELIDIEFGESEACVSIWRPVADLLGEADGAVGYVWFEYD